MECSLRAGFLAVYVAASVAFLSQASVKTQKPVYYTFCFWDAFSRWRSAPHSFGISDIPAELCSAVVYSHVTIDNNSGWVKLTEQELKLDPEAKAYSESFIYNPIWVLPPHRAFRELSELKKRNPKLKILLAVGGPQDPAEKYWQFFNKMHLWRYTASSVAQWLKTYEFDGVVFDFFSGPATAQDSIWTWDTGRLIHPFFREIRTKFRQTYITDWRIVFTLPAFDSVTQRLFDIDRLSEVVNFFIVKTSDCLEFPKGSGLNVTRTMDMTDIDRAELIVKKGAGRLRVVLDIPLSGRTYSATGSASGRHTVFTGRAGPYTQKQGFMSAYEVCEQMRSGWTQHRSGEEACPFLRSDQEFVAYEDEESIRRKARMVKGRGYRGVAIRTVDLDDYSGSCAGNSHLLKTVRSSLDATSPDVDFPYDPPNETWWEEDMFSTKSPYRPRVTATPNASNSSSNPLHLTSPDACVSSVTATSPQPYATSSVSAAVEPKPKSDICKNADSNTLLPHESDCSKYYQCVHSTPHLRTCSSNTIFDIERQICNWPALANRPECII